MGIESNKEAVAMMKNALGSIENRFREAYNKGYKDGLRDGASQVTARLVSKILEEAEAEPQTSGVVWTEDAIKNEPKSYTAWASTDDPQTIKVGMATDSVTGKVLGITADTDCAWK